MIGLFLVFLTCTQPWGTGISCGLCQLWRSFQPGVGEMPATLVRLVSAWGSLGSFLCSEGKLCQAVELGPMGVFRGLGGSLWEEGHKPRFTKAFPALAVLHGAGSPSLSRRETAWGRTQKPVRVRHSMLFVPWP